MPKFSNIQSLNQFKDTHKDKQLLKESSSNQVIGAIDEKNNLFILNPDYTLSIGYSLKNNYDSLSITNRHDVGIKFSKDDIKIKMNSDSDEKSLLDIIKSSIDQHSNSLTFSSSIESKEEYSDKKAFKACNNKLNAKTINNCNVDDNKLSNKTIWSAQKTNQELLNKPDKNHTHNLEDIKNLPVSKIIFQEELTTQINELNNTNNIHFNQINQEIKNKSNKNHNHNLKDINGIETVNNEINEIRELIKNKAHFTHTHQDLSKQINNKLDLKEFSKFKTEIKQTQEYKSKIIDSIQNKASLFHTHSEDSIQNLDKYSKAEIDKFLSKKAKTNHSHSAAQITNPEDIYSDKDSINVIHNLIDRELLITKKDVLDKISKKSDLNHTHDINNQMDTIFNSLKVKLRDYLKYNLTAKNSNLLENQPARNFAGVNHNHNFQDLKNNHHTHKETEILNLDKYTKKETDNLINTRSFKKHKHNVSEIINLPKPYTDRNVKILINNEFINDDLISSETLFSSSKIDSLINSKAPAVHTHNLEQIKNIKGYIERTVETSVKNNKHIHSFLDLQDKPKVYNDKRIKDIALSQIKDDQISNTTLWSSSKIRHEFEVLHDIIKNLRDKGYG